MQNSDPQRTPKRPTGIVRLRAVVIHENRVKAAIAKEGAAEFSDVRRCLHPDRSFRVEISKFLQLSILSFRQQLNAHGICHAHCAISWFMFFPRFQRFTVVAKTRSEEHTSELQS